LGNREKFVFAGFNFGKAPGEDFLCQPGDSNLYGLAAIERQRSSIACNRSAKLMRLISKASIMAEK